MAMVRVRNPVQVPSLGRSSDGALIEDASHAAGAKEASGMTSRTVGTVPEVDVDGARDCDQ